MDLDEQLAEACPDIRYLQIKEKFGGLRVYVIAGGPEAKPLIRAAVEKAYRTCETCGAPGRMRRRGEWCYTLCDEHAADGGYELVVENEPKAVAELTPETRGRWLVTTQGSMHIWDMDAMTYTRLPGKDSLSGRFDYDDEPQRITRIERFPKVGSYSVVFYDDPAEPMTREQRRQSSVITSIERLPDARR